MCLVQEEAANRRVKRIATSGSAKLSRRTAQPYLEYRSKWPLPLTTQRSIGLWSSLALQTGLIAETMAEVLGVVASGIAVVDAAGQIGSGIMKLKKLWSEVKDVPETINSLMQQLELLTVVIGEMETIQQSSVGDAMRPFNSQGMQLSMMRCREAMDTLDHLVSKLAMHVDSEQRSKRARAKLKVALSKDNLAQCHDRLKDTVQLLQFAQGCYQMYVRSGHGTWLVLAWFD